MKNGGDPLDKFERKVTKMGNSTGLTIPSEVLEHSAVKLKDEVSFRLE